MSVPVSLSTAWCSRPPSTETFNLQKPEHVC